MKESEKNNAPLKKLRTSIAVFWINTCCTLKCKDCITMTPYHKNPVNFPKEDIIRDIHAFFEIYDWVNHFDIEGGESLLHPQLFEILEKALEYRQHFGRIHILTNGTLLPGEKLLGLAGLHNIFFIIDDYGELSCKKEELVSLLKARRIHYRVDTYCGDSQYCGGWMDFGDMSYKSYTQGEKNQVFSACRQAHCGAPYIKNGRIYLCSIQAAQMSHIPLREGEYVPLSPSVPLEEKIRTASRFGAGAVEACNYCNGFDVKNGKRIKAAEQISQSAAGRKDIICL